MKNKKLFMILITVVAVIAAVGAVLMLTVFRSASADSAFRQVLGVICGITLFLMAALLAYYVYLIADHEPNFFLYQKNTHRNMSVDKLTFSVVNEKMAFYLSLIDPEKELLWTTDLLSQDDRFGFRRVYRPLVAYKMLFDLIVAESQDEWDRLIHAPAVQVELLCDALEQNKEAEMTKAIRFIHANYHSQPQKMITFVKGNKKYIQGKMLSYVRANIEKFF